ncbi:MAG: hypothetical protein ACRD0P_21325, partial [Stackebrandtia sp.]
EITLPVDIIEIATEPKAITALPEPPPRPQRPRGAPLFSRRDKSSSNADKDTKASKKKQPKAARQSQRDSSTSTAGLPRIKFDFTTVPVDPGRPPSAGAPPLSADTSEQPAVPRQRQMNVGGLRHGWQAAEQAAAPPAAAYGEEHLPKREPMAQLVPGAVETTTREVPVVDDVPVYRDPVSASAAYVAYAKTRTGHRS